jgi:hypothetical protein
MVSGEMRPQNWIAVCCVVLSIASAGASLYFAVVFRFAVGLQGPPTFTGDQILASLTLMVGLVGLIVAVAAVAIAMIAVFGYGEIRQIASRRTDELLKNIIGSLRKRREITASEAAELWQGIQGEQLAEIEPAPAAPSSNGSNPLPMSRGGGQEDEVEKYPSGERK